MAPSCDVITVRGILVGRGAAVDVTLRDGMVVAVGPAGRGNPDVGSKITVIAPTLFDIQVNGYAGIDLQAATVAPEDLAHINDRLAAWGVSHWVPTIITGAQGHMERSCRVIAEAMQEAHIRRAVPGIHLEGPYISPEEGPRGAHPKAHVRKPSLREFDRFMTAADGKILYITLAPEVEGAIPFIKRMVAQGVVVSLGHHQATARQIARAVDAGARLCTHLGNALAPRIQRHFNPLWPQLADDRLTATLIADLEHLPEPALKTFVRAKRPEKVILTSDVVHIAGLRPGAYKLCGQRVELNRSGRISLSGTELLGGSSLMLLQGVINTARVTDMTLEQAFASAGAIPAELLGVSHRFRPPSAGDRANFIAFDIDRSTRRWKPILRAVFIHGRRCAVSLREGVARMGRSNLGVRRS